VKTTPKYLIEIILIVNVKDSDEVRKIANCIIDLPISDSKIENKIETMRYEEIVQIKNQKPR
jgi:hypothetical protein